MTTGTQRDHGSERGIRESDPSDASQCVETEQVKVIRHSPFEKANRLPEEQKLSIIEVKSKIG